MTAASDRADGLVVLTARRDAGAGLQLVTLTPSAELAQAYRSPGQYIQVLQGESSGYFAFAGEIEAPSWELLVRNSGGAADVLATAPEGTTLGVVGPLGTGFPLDRARGRTLAIAVVGSALAVARPILRERIARRECDRTHVYIGVRSLADLPLAGEVAGWARAGARLVLCLSRPPATEVGEANAIRLPGVVRRTGWVQRVLAEDLEAGLFQNALVFAAGPQAMLDETRELATRPRPHPPGATNDGGGGRLDGSSDLVELEVITNV